MVDVDGSYMFRKHQRMAESGVNVAPLGIPPPPISGWDSVTEDNFRSLSGDIPRVTSGEYIMSMRCMHVLAHKLFYHLYRYGVQLSLGITSLHQRARSIQSSDTWVHSLGIGSSQCITGELPQPSVLPCSFYHETFHEGR